MLKMYKINEFIYSGWDKQLEENFVISDVQI